MNIGLHIVQTEWRGGAPALGKTLRDMVRTADATGFDVISVADHLWQHPIMGGPETSHIEAYTTLGFIAAHTERVRLLALATCVPFRPAGLLAKMVTTLDVLSGGRMMLGIGAGDYPEEAEGLGVPYPSTRERFELLEETVQACLAMWEGKQGSGEAFEGEHVHLGRALNLPQAISRPHPSILIAGGGERRTLPLVAKYADACNIPPRPDLPDKLDLLRRLCEQEGRDYGEIEKTVPYAFDVGDVGDVGDDGAKVPEVLEQLHRLSEMGAETVMGWVNDMEQLKSLEIMGRDVIPVVAEWR